MAKAFYKIGEACKHLDIQPYVLRYWETEFPMLEPETSKSGQRVYSHDDMGVIQRIKELLYDEGFTIAGAKKKLEAELADGREMTFAPPVGPKPVPAPELQKKPEPQKKPELQKEQPARKPVEETEAATKPAGRAITAPTPPKPAAVESREAKATAKPAKKSATKKTREKTTAQTSSTKKSTAEKSATAKSKPKAGKKTASAPPATGGKAAPRQPDPTAEPETRARVRQLEKGIRSALEEARAILSILENEPAAKQATKK